jgi:hypothetical protein
MSEAAGTPRRERTNKALIVALVVLACISGLGTGAVLMRLGLLAPESLPKSLRPLVGPTPTPPPPQPHAQSHATAHTNTHPAGPHRARRPGPV